jgi:hypothetical protein
MGYNPAGPSSPASNTMSVFQYNAGARTRNVVNIAAPGETVPAYSFSATNSAPNSANEGFANFRSQKTLHVLVDNNRNTGNVVLKFWFYNSSLGGQWSELSQLVRLNNADTLTFATLPTPTVASGATLRFTLPIDGVERIAVEASTVGGASGACDVYLGVNTI